MLDYDEFNFNSTAILPISIAFHISLSIFHIIRRTNNSVDISYNIFNLSNTFPPNSKRNRNFYV